MSLASAHPSVTPPVGIRRPWGTALHVAVVPGAPTPAGPSTRCTVQLAGEIDFATADVLAGTLDERRREGHRFVRLDLSRLSFIDCAGLGVLIDAHHRFLHDRGTLVLTGVDGRVATMLRITELDGTLLVAEGFDAPGAPDSSREIGAAVGRPHR